jgi:hypothetical protein
MAELKELLYKLTNSYKDRVEKAQETARKMIKVNEAAKEASREARSAKAQPSPKK